MFIVENLDSIDKQKRKKKGIKLEVSSIFPIYNS